MVALSDIERVRASRNRGYEIVFSDGRVIALTKSRTVSALLVLIHKGRGCEADLSHGNDTVPEIRRLLGQRLPPGIVRDHYGDANKPFSELWNEEGFPFIRPDGRLGLSRAYALRPGDHDLLFGPARKAHRRPPNAADRALLMDEQDGRCNICGSKLGDAREGGFFKDRTRPVFDHRRPVEKGGSSEGCGNHQALCFACNKAKWQVCGPCAEPSCDGCALAWPERSRIVRRTGEDISDRMRHRA